MKILFVSPAIEEKSRGIGAIFKSLVESAEAEGHEVYLLLGNPVRRPFAGSQKVSDKLSHLYAQTYMNDGRDSLKDLANRKNLKFALLEGMLSFSFLRSATTKTNSDYLSGPKTVLNTSDYFVSAPFFYIILNFLPTWVAQAVLNRIVRRNNIDLVVLSSPTKISNLRTPARVAHFVHDTIPIDIVEAPSDNDTPRKYASQFVSTCKHSDLLFANSKDTASKILDENPKANVHVLYGTSSSRRKDVARGKILTKLGLKPKKFLLFTATLEKRKNVPTLLRAYEKVYKDIDMPLVLVGSEGHGYEEIAQTLEAMPASIRKKIHVTGYVNEADKFQLFDNAFAFVLPSTYEGMGLMLIEAMESGIPIITSRRGALEEAGGDAALYIDDPYDVDELAQVIVRLYNDPDLVKRLVAAGKKQKTKFSFTKFRERFKKALASLEKSRASKQTTSNAVSFSIFGQILSLNRQEMIIMLAIFINFLNYWPSLSLSWLGSASIELSMLSGFILVTNSLWALREKFFKLFMQQPLFFALYVWVLYGVSVALYEGADAKTIGFKFLYLVSIILGVQSIFFLHTVRQINFMNIMRAWVVMALLMVPLFIIQYIAVGFGADWLSKRAYQVGIFQFPRLHGFSFEPLFLANWLLIPLLFSLVSKGSRTVAFWLSVVMFLTLGRGAVIGMAIALLFFILTSRDIKAAFSHIFKTVAGAFVVVLVLVGVISSLNDSSALEGSFRYVDHLTLGVLNKGGASNIEYREVIIDGEVVLLIDESIPDTEGVVEASTVSRVQSVRQGIVIFESKPVTGYGLFNISGGSEDVFPELTSEGFVANSQLIDILAETGLIGVFLLSLFVVPILRRMVLRSILTLCLVALLVQYVFFTNLFLISVWFVLAAIAANMKIKELQYE